MKILYISYDGLTDFLGQSQVLPYLIGCAGLGHRITVLSFEKPDRMAKLGDQVREQCATAGLSWHPQPFRSSPPVLAKLLDLRSMRRSAHRLAVRGNFDLVHCRSYPSALAGLSLKRKSGLPFVFDMRGFWPDQKRDGRHWSPSSLVGRAIYARWKAIEARLVGSADHVVVLTDAARALVESWPSYAGAPISVIPCCTDFELFRPSTEAERLELRREIGLPDDAPTLLYVGSLGTVYLLETQLRLFDAIRRRDPRAKFLVIGRNRQSELVEEARKLGIDLKSDDVRALSAERGEMARWISLGDVGTCFYVPTPSSLGVSPTKLAEYLACGVPAIGNRGVGDIESILGAIEAGHVLPDLTETSIEAAADAFFRLRMLPRADIRQRARALLDLPLAVAAYARIYASPSMPTKAAELPASPAVGTR